MERSREFFPDSTISKPSWINARVEGVSKPHLPHPRFIFFALPSRATAQLAETTHRDSTSLDMYTDSSSPFDEALSSPLLAEPIKKKWSLPKPSTWFRRKSKQQKLTETTSSIAMTEQRTMPIALDVETGDGEAHLYDAETEKSLESEKASEKVSDLPSRKSTTESCPMVDGKPGLDRKNCVVSHPLEDWEEETASLLREISIDDSFGEQAPLLVVTNDVDLAIMQEREDELEEIAGSMRQIRDIQLGKFRC